LLRRADTPTIIYSPVFLAARYGAAVLLLRSEVTGIRHYPIDQWMDYTHGSRRADELARELWAGTGADAEVREATARIAALYEGGSPVPPIIVATDGRTLACIEGNMRIASYLLSRAESPLPAILGESPDMAQWSHF
jgi:hypothetical protein